MYTPSDNHTTEFVYDEFVWVILEHGFVSEQSKLRYVCSNEQLAIQLRDNIVRNEHTNKWWLEIIKWPITRHYGEIPRQTGAVGQASKGN